MLGRLAQGVEHAVFIDLVDPAEQQALVLILEMMNRQRRHDRVIRSRWKLRGHVLQVHRHHALAKTLLSLGEHLV